MKYFLLLLSAFALSEAHSIKMKDNFDLSPDSVSVGDNLEQSHTVKQAYLDEIEANK